MLCGAASLEIWRAGTSAVCPQKCSACVQRKQTMRAHQVMLIALPGHSARSAATKSASTSVTDLSECDEHMALRSLQGWSVALCVSWWWWQPFTAVCMPPWWRATRGRRKYVVHPWWLSLELRQTWRTDTCCLSSQTPQTVNHLKALAAALCMAIASVASEQSLVSEETVISQV